jgi:hypothetical protein
MARHDRISGTVKHTVEQAPRERGHGNDPSTIALQALEDGNPMAPRRLSVTVLQGAAVLGVSQPTVWGLMGPDGPLESFTIGRRRLILWDSIEALVESRRGIPGDARRNRTVPPLGAKMKGREEVDLAIKDMELSTRSRNALLNDGIKTVKDLCGKTDAELLLIPNLGRGSVREIAAALVKRGLREKDGGNAR